jgi:para-nitrobenzyl esterase
LTNFISEKSNMIRRVNPSFTLSTKLLIAATLSILSGPAIAASSQVSTGSYMGSASVVDETITVYRGIPFALPPVGRLRWQPPYPQPSFTGVRRAETFGAPCWQPIVPETSIYSRGQMQVSEDCLYLNVWTRTASVDPAPVLVWFHGGGNTTGHAHSKIFDGSRLAAKGAVVVTANYRLGAMGFMAHPALTRESSQHSSGNYGLLDQIMALEWVAQQEKD